MAGLGSGGALIAAVVVALIALGGVVAVEGLPDSSKSSSVQNVLVENEMAAVNADVTKGATTGVRVRAKVPAGKDPGKPAKADPRGGDRGFGEGDPAAPLPLPPATVPSEVPSLTPPSSAPHTSQPSNPPHHNPPNPQPTPPPAIPTPIPTHQGPVGGLVGVANETVHGATGIDPHLPGTIAPVTNPIDEVIAGLTGGSLPPLPRR